MRSTSRAGAIASALVIQSVLFFSITTQAWAGLHFTNEEIAIWKTRKDNGPYKDEWNVIFNQATAWKNNPGSRFTGWTSDTCYNGSRIPSNRSLDDGLRDAAFVYLVTGDTSYRDAVRTALLQQASISGTNFANTQRWCATNATLDGYGDNLAPWLRKLVYAYSYVRDTLSSSDRSTLDNWFLNAGKHFDTVLHNVVKKRFPNRYNDNYSSCSSTCPSDAIGITHYGGHTVYRFGEAWSNKGTSINATVAAIGVVVNDATLIDHSKRYVKEWIKYATYPGGQINDQFRWGGVYTSGSTSPQHGFFYSGLSIGSIVSAVDHFARSGDTSLYEFETSDGMFGSQGGPKSLKRILQHFAGMATGKVVEYASNSATSNSGLIIDSENEAQFGQTRVEFVNITPANVYYKDSAIAAAYQLPIPSSFDTVGCSTLQGEWCTYPRVRFMFGQMEGKVGPYQNQAPNPDISVSPPSNLRVMPLGQ